jgi:peptidoglycan/xylan/chitin deacetylase (PgdA/CDA1 family)
MSLALSTVAGAGLAHSALEATRPRAARIAGAAAIPSAPGAVAAPPLPGSSALPLPDAVLPPPSAGSRVALPAGGMLYSLPGDGDRLALTLDDGVNSEVVRLYTQFATDTGVRLTYFLNGVNASWTEHADMLRPLVDSGQIQLGNHTWSHPDLTKIGASEAAEQIRRNHRFIDQTYGVDARPFVRPPYGFHNDRVRAIATDLGYTATTLWNGSLSDSTLITEDYITQMAAKYFTAQRIVIGHLNHLPVTHVYGTLVDLIRTRSLRTVTLNDVFLREQL